LIEGRYVEVPNDPATGMSGGVLTGWVISRFISSTGANMAIGSGGATTITTLYSVEDIFVNHIPSWSTAKDPKTNEILNGAFFKYANVSQSQT